MSQQLSAMRLTLVALGEKRVLHQLFEVLNLPYLDWIAGYWDFRFADCTRIKKYCREYSCASLSDDQKFAVMSLIVASYGELLAMRINKQEYKSSLWALIANLIQTDRAIHSAIIEHWCNFDDADLAIGAFYFQKFEVQQVSKLMKEMF